MIFPSNIAQQLIYSLSHYPTDLVNGIMRGAGANSYRHSGRLSENVVDHRGAGPDDIAPYTEDGAWAAVTNPYPPEVANSMGLTMPYLHQAGKPGNRQPNMLHQWLIRALRGED